jgi:hypothetical protein
VVALEVEDTIEVLIGVVEPGDDMFEEMDGAMVSFGAGRVVAEQWFVSLVDLSLVCIL